NWSVSSVTVDNTTAPFVMSLGYFSSVSLTAAHIETIGNLGTGAWIQNGGINAVSGTEDDGLYVGKNYGATGTYTLNFGSLRLPKGMEGIGWYGVGIVNQISGTNNCGRMIIGTQPGSTGTYNLGGGSLAAIDYEVIAESGTGTFNQTGGMNSVGTVGIGFVSI